MLIQSTKALLKKIGIKESELAFSEGAHDFPEKLLAWHANIVTINRRKAVILMNNETRYPVVIYGLTKNDFSNIKKLIQEAIREALRIEGVRTEIIKEYIAKAGEISFSKTANRSMIAKMNNAVRNIEFNEEYLDKKTVIQRYISILGGRHPQYSEEDDYFLPLEKMLECLRKIYDQDANTTAESLLDINLFQLKVNIDMEGHDIWRRVLVPSTYSFRHLHNIIQTIFDWQNYHLHEFNVERGDHKPLKIVMDDHPEILDYFDTDAFDSEQERFVALEDIFPTFNKVIYEYDFGDSWEHGIILEKVVKSKTFQATYVDGSGERPPEDVGGEWGYNEYIDIIRDEQHPEYESMKIWAGHQRERIISKEKINNRLKRVIHGYSYSTYI